MSDLTISIRKTLANEGGFQKNSDDRANWSSGVIGTGTLVGTKYGITAVDLPGIDIENLTEDQAIAYYKEHYVKDLYAQIESQDIADKLFDMGVLFGVGEAVKLLQIVIQTAITTLTVDDNFGPETLAAVNQVGETSLLQAYKTALVTYALRIAVNKPTQQQFVAGWGRRINS